MSASNSPIYRILNRTTHTVSIKTADGVVVNYKSDGIAFRVQSLSEPAGIILAPDNGGTIREFQVFEAGFGGTIIVAYNYRYSRWEERGDMDVPEMHKNTIYIVSANVKMCNPQRPDFFAPGAGIFEDAHTDSGQNRSVKVAAIGFNGIFK